jgi:hypothetical protein
MYRKKATREIDRSSYGERLEAKMERSNEGVTGIRLFFDNYVTLNVLLWE